jgi:sec-independent protein translocase protein TatA
MPHFNPVELIIVLLIVLILFGGGRVGKLGGELGTAIREFRRGMQGEGEPKPTDEATAATTVAPDEKTDKPA